MSVNKRKRGYSLVMVLVMLVIGGAFVGLAFQMVESRHRLGTVVMAQKGRYNTGISALERAKGWIHTTIINTGKLPVRPTSGDPTSASDLLIRSSDGYAIYDLAYPSLGASMDVSLIGFPQWELSSSVGSIAEGDYPSSNGGVSKVEGEGLAQTGIYLIRSFSVEGGGYEVVLTEGL